ncbi:hypothetical protein RhiirA1_480916, partial [Rhizophagus irregularis]
WQIYGVDKVENLRGVEIIPVIANIRKVVPIIIELNTGGNLQAVFGRTRKVLPGGLLIAMHMIPITKDGSSIDFQNPQYCGFWK